MKGKKKTTHKDSFSRYLKKIFPRRQIIDSMIQISIITINHKSLCRIIIWLFFIASGWFAFHLRQENTKKFFWSEIDLIFACIHLYLIVTGKCKKIERKNISASNYNKIVFIRFYYKNNQQCKMSAILFPNLFNHFIDHRFNLNTIS